MVVSITLKPAESTKILYILQNKYFYIMIYKFIILFLTDVGDQIRKSNEIFMGDYTYYTTKLQDL